VKCANNSSISGNESELKLTFKQLAPAPAPLEFHKELQLLWKSLAPAPSSSSGSKALLGMRIQIL